MSRTVSSEWEIDAPPQDVWSVLTDFDAFPSWNPFIRRAEGHLAVGERLKIKIVVYGKRTTTFEPRVTRVDAPHELRWQARTIAPGLMDVERGFAIDAIDGQRSRLRQWETCTGVLVPLLFGPGKLGVHLEEGYARMNVAIAARVPAEVASRN